ncbi:DUF5947 family protein [Geodermatophilus sp. YIM 151500]|uniref:DUF5947 family protein n=1 Tax=Geodermatophilus sp. YIM 151500 TaxID=2984531 RepID=UPI0021E4B356|nr:DUF5947 family protein [Geodermatophilus sp. YIM 151500]MCV2487921.1 DUF5947 family protein [Geodermatophilus sp. YIM 151500]
MTATPALERVIRRAAGRLDGVERCDLCAAPVAERHRHMVDSSNRELLCACPACAVLFSREAAGRGHYRLVPGTRLRLADPEPGQQGVPVGLAFFVRRPDGSVDAHYPSPLGATRWEVSDETWARLEAECPELARLQPDVQALLVDTAHGARERWIVPIDDCYRLVALVRATWTGLSGGTRVWPAVEQFFAELGGRAAADHRGGSR